MIVYVVHADDTFDTQIFSVPTPVLCSNLKAAKKYANKMCIRWQINIKISKLTIMSK